MRSLSNSKCKVSTEPHHNSRWEEEMGVNCHWRKHTCARPLCERGRGRLPHKSDIRMDASKKKTKKKKKKNEKTLASVLR